MFFPERITNVGSKDRVLEVGPGGTPHIRSDVFLEKIFHDKEHEALQRSNSPALKTNKPVFYYDGHRFPFKDREFDYVICSHVMEHVPNLEEFVSELCRVSCGGYVEFPTVYYEYLYNIPTHCNVLLKRDNVVYYKKKEELNLQNFLLVQQFFLKTLEFNYDDIVKDLKNYFFQGFEWKESIEIVKGSGLESITYDIDNLNLLKKSKKNFFRRILG